jgi:hypothetical protein
MSCIVEGNVWLESLESKLVANELNFGAGII